MKEAAATAAAVTVAGFVGGLPPGMVSVAAGLVAVYVARLVFIDRENRRLHRRAPWRETMPLTVAAMLLAAGLIYDQAMGVAGAIYTGLGVGWVAVVGLDMLGGRLINLLQVAIGGRMPGDMPLVDPAANAAPPPGANPPPTDAPPSFSDLLDQVDAADRAGKFGRKES